jgi:UDPglucose 6-dehydrogenase
MLGAAFKPDSDDVRDSPALDVAAALSNAGAEVVVHDPKALANAARVFPRLVYQGDLDAALAGSDLVILGTEWREYRELNPTHAATLVAHPRIIDARNVLDPTAWRTAGWTYRALGRPTA